MNDDLSERNEFTEEEKWQIIHEYNAMAFERWRQKMENNSDESSMFYYACYRQLVKAEAIDQETECGTLQWISPENVAETDTETEA